ncbi:hypothetical protein [Rhodopseudomonas sp. B29]|uniref:hypothetical protein n=1 Tax=Rhodopseudomonas sp. B29 TaxID=95607 RepID=UPI0011D1DEBB|nr:hypothetical protein [Rhodopseudomonas sp. B29]
MSALIEDYLRQLVGALGQIAPPIDADKLGQLYLRGDYPAMLGWIKNSMKIELRIGLRIVDLEAPSPPMWIEVPTPLPRPGTLEHQSARAIVNARRDWLVGKPFGWIVACFAHELSHVVLFALDHPLQHEEKAVDLTAMILGYDRFIVTSEATTKHWNIWSILLSILLLRFGVVFFQGPAETTERLGYLSSAEAEAARRWLTRRTAATSAQ